MRGLVVQEVVLTLGEDRGAVRLHLVEERPQWLVGRQRVRWRLEAVQLSQDAGQLGRWRYRPGGVVVIAPEGDDTAVSLDGLLEVERSSGRKAARHEPARDL